MDAFSTALVMQNWEVVDQILAFVQTIDFDKAIGDVSLFETTIRYLGGLLSGMLFRVYLCYGVTGFRFLTLFQHTIS